MWLRMNMRARPQVGPFFVQVFLRTHFRDTLAEHLRSDTDALFKLLRECGPWDSSNDAKMGALHRLVTERHPHEKVLVFSQFADTVDYLKEHLRSRGVDSLEAVTGNSENPTDMVRRFSPVANECRKEIPPEKEIRVLLSTDILSEGQNLQDSFVVVNFDLPWAIPAGSAGRSRGPYRAASRDHSLLFVPSGGRCGADHPSPVPRSAAPSRERRSSRFG